jgi:hypothetical protein
METAKSSSIRLKTTIASSLRALGALIIKLTRAIIARSKALLARGRGGICHERQIYSPKGIG